MGEELSGLAAGNPACCAAKTSMDGLRILQPGSIDTLEALTMTQLQLLLTGGIASAPLWFARPKRRSLTPAVPFIPWQQLRLRLPLRGLIRKGQHFIWTRPDGRQFVCRTMRALVARVMDYDGHLLRGLLKAARQ
jgi:hypothetical protein